MSRPASRTLGSFRDPAGAVRRSLPAAVATLLLLGICGISAQAGVYTDDLSKCLVKATSTNDRVVLVRWMFATLALHPAVRSFVSVPDAQRDTATKAAAGLFTRLLTADCRKESVNALKYEGVAAIGASFQVLGQVASRDLMSDPNVAKGMRQLGADIDSDQKLKDLLKDAGIATKTK
jgi:hypothetical protein